MTPIESSVSATGQRILSLSPAGPVMRREAPKLASIFEGRHCGRLTLALLKSCTVVHIVRGSDLCVFVTLMWASGSEICIKTKFKIATRACKRSTRKSYSVHLTEAPPLFFFLFVFFVVFGATCDHTSAHWHRSASWSPACSQVRAMRGMLTDVAEERGQRGERRPCDAPTIKFLRLRSRQSSA